VQVGDNIKEVRWKDVSWICLVQEAGLFEYGNEPVGSIKRGEILNHLWTIRFGKRRILFHGVGCVLVKVLPYLSANSDYLTFKEYKFKDLYRLHV
jgi:hypothetical protein